MIQQSDLFQIGFIQRPHGVNGAVTMRFTDDVFDRAGATYLFLKLDGLFVPFFIEEYRFRSDEAVILKLENIDTEAQAQAICSTEVHFPYTLIPDREEEPLTWNYLTGFRVDGVAEGYIGNVLSVDSSNFNILLNVRKENGIVVQLPFHENLMVKCDEKSRTLLLSLPEGLLTLNE